MQELCIFICSSLCPESSNSIIPLNHPPNLLSTTVQRHCFPIRAVSTIESEQEAENELRVGEGLRMSDCKLEIK